MSTKEELTANVASAEAAVVAARRALLAFIAAPENNVFASVDEASGVLEDRLLAQAHDDCEGSYNCGADEYTQEFIVDGKHYLAKLTCEYNRHDKTYYYVEESNFTVSEVP